MIEHIVLIRWKDGLAREEIDAALAKAAIMEGIAGVESLVCRRTLGPTNARDKGVTDVLTIRFANEAARAAFGSAPLHQEISEHMIPLVEDATIVDVPA